MRMLSVLLLFFFASVAQAEFTYEQALQARQDCDDAKFTEGQSLTGALQEKTSADNARVAALSARANCTIQSYLDQGDARFGSGDNYYAEGAQLYPIGVLAHNLAYEKYGTALNYWNAGNWDQAKLWFDAARFKYQDADENFEDVTADYMCAETEYTAAKDHYIAGQGGSQ